MVIEIRAKGVTELHITKNLVELQEIFFGSALAYDEGIASSDAVIGAALWRYSPRVFSCCLHGDASFLSRTHSAVWPKWSSLCLSPTNVFLTAGICMGMRSMPNK